MKIEKINENKIRITLTDNELEERNLDFKSLRYNTPEAQTLFWDMMKKAETEHGFKTANCQLFIEAASIMGGQFIVTITKLHEKGALPDIKKKPSVPILKVRKKTESTSTHFICKFDNFEQICEVISSGNVSTDLSSVLYEYKNIYFLVVKLNNEEKINKLKMVFSEFGEIINDYSYVDNILNEHGNKIIKNHALEKIASSFSL